MKMARWAFKLLSHVEDVDHFFLGVASVLFRNLLVVFDACKKCLRIAGRAFHLPNMAADHPKISAHLPRRERFCLRMGFVAGFLWPASKKFSRCFNANLCC